MGLDTTHEAFHGPYSHFSYWRKGICKAAGLGDLKDFEGYGGTKSLSEIDKPGIRILLSHSDCDGEISPTECKYIADDLWELLPKINHDNKLVEKDLKNITAQFIGGCMIAYHRNEILYFN